MVHNDMDDGMMEWIDEMCDGNMMDDMQQAMQK